MTVTPVTPLQALSYGGGVNTVALAILNVTGQVSDPAQHAIFADPGSEHPGTYAHLEIMVPWLRERGLTFIRRYGAGRRNGKLSQGMGLYEYVWNRATVIPVQGDTGLARRQCTVNWKMDVVKGVLRELGCGPKARSAVSQIGIAYDEIHRIKDSPDRWITNRWPLVDLKLTRADCRNIIREAGLPIPPKSACIFCPLQRNSQWQYLASMHPDLFEQAAKLEDIIAARRNGSSWLSNKHRPLRQAFSTAQALLPMAEDEEDSFGLCGGNCDV